MDSQATSNIIYPLNFYITNGIAFAKRQVEIPLLRSRLERLCQTLNIFLNALIDISIDVFRASN